MREFMVAMRNNSGGRRHSIDPFVVTGLSWDDVQESHDGLDLAAERELSDVIDPNPDRTFWRLEEGLDWAREAELELDSK